MKRKLADQQGYLVTERGFERELGGNEILTVTMESIADALLADGARRKRRGADRRPTTSD